MANEEHLSSLKQGVKVWNSWRRDNPDIRPDLSGANLSEANLSGANLSVAQVHGANLVGAITSGVNLRGAILIGALLSRTGKMR